MDDGVDKNKDRTDGNAAATIIVDAVDTPHQILRLLPNAITRRPRRTGMMMMNHNRQLL
jgi:hypothetical protein